MENEDAPECEGEESGSHPSEQLFNVVYDPHFDRFFLEDEVVYRGRKRKEYKAVSIPWEKWILPPKSPPKRDRQGDDKGEGSIQNPSSASEVKSGNGNQTSAIPAFDLSSLQQPSAEVAIFSDTVAAKKQKKKLRVKDYGVHFKRNNQDAAKTIAASVTSAETNDDHEVKWNGEVLHVQFPGLVLEGGNVRTNGGAEPDALERERLRVPAEDHLPSSIYELKNLMKIRAHADGLRRVNLANHFVTVSSSESSDSEEEVALKESEDERELMPVFFRYDRVLFHAKRRWFKGTVRRRIPKSDFYTIRADSGTLFDAILASKMELLDEPEELPYYHYMKGDRVLWIPDSKHAPDLYSSSDDEELTYKAKIVHVRSLNRFDVLLRTGRVVKKVPYEQLRPRDASEFVSTTTTRRR